MAVKQLNIDSHAHSYRFGIVGHRDVLSQSIEGNWATSFKGHGMEFTGYRSYSYSDDASLIDWRASLRAKETLVREFEEFKNFKILFLLDVSDSMLFTTTDKFKAEFGAELVHALSQSAARSGDAVGLGLFSDHLVKTIEPSFGKGLIRRLESTLIDSSLYGGPRDFKKSFLELNSVLSDRTVIIVVSDFLGLPSDWQKYLSLLSIKHQVMGIMLKDVRDRDLSGLKGQFFLKDPNASESHYVDVKHYEKAYKQESLNHEKYVKNVFKKLRSDCALIINGEAYYRPLMKFFSQLRYSE